MASLLFVDHSAQLGGAELSLLDIVEGFRAESHVVLLEDGPFAERLRARGLAVTVLPTAPSLARLRRNGSLLDDLRAAWGLLQTARALRPYISAADLVYANSQKSMFAASLSALGTGVPVVWHLRDLLVADHFSASHRRLAATWANGFVTRVIANSAATRDAFCAAGGNSERVTVVHNGIDPTNFANLPSQHEARRTLGLPDRPLIGVFSRLAPWKGQHVVLEAAASLPEVHVLLVGDALFEGDAPYTDTLRATVEQLGMSDRVHFLGFRTDIPMLMRAVDVVVHSSISAEPFGRVVVEGLLAGTPVIATRAGGVPEIIDHDRTGVLVPPNDPTALRDALSRLLNAPDLAEQLSQAGARAAREQFSTTRLHENLTRVLGPLTPPAGVPSHPSSPTVS